MFEQFWTIRLHQGCDLGSWLSGVYMCGVGLLLVLILFFRV